MKNKLKRAVSALMVAGVLATSTVPVLAATAHVGGGIWNYGTQIVDFNKKLVYSSYYHPTKTHRTSVSIGTTYASSGWVGKGKTAYARAIGSRFSVGKAYYSCK
ncbi:MAG: lactococcin 972 family bacteriocin [Lachnospiraceae bacterium]|nr:lactococcin 972 family bacteriocin [Lachnospiraceae bacterium]